MYVEKKYSFKDLLIWTRWEILLFLIVGLIPALLIDLAGWRWLHLPWTPIALIGTAVAFLIGFQNNAAYGRAWEARQIWGGIVNASRSWTVMVRDMVTNEYAEPKADEGEISVHRTALVERHIAWLTALRHAMRQPRPWETSALHRTNQEWRDKVRIPEQAVSLDSDLEPLLSPEELNEATAKTNKPAAILSMQSRHLRALKERGLIWEFSFLELEGLVRELFTLQGKSERIKNFPYPRQYATLSYDVVRVFIALLPFGVIPEFADMGIELGESYPLIGRYFIWVGVPFTAAVSWVFHTLQRIGTVGENPFEGTPNDVPISTMSRAIEIDLRQLLDQDAERIPKPLETQHGVQM